MLITAGASAPERVVQDCVQWLQKRYDAVVEERTLREEEVYFPLPNVAPESMLIEPTETESLEQLDAFVDAMVQIAREAAQDPNLLRDAPHDTPVRRLDEATAARKPILRFRTERE